VNVSDSYRHSFITSFSRSQVAAFIATVLDYGTLFLLTEVFQVWYVVATAVGALCGAVANFLINRYWSFQATHDRLGYQALRYALVSTGSLIFNTGGVFLVTEFAQVHYAVSVAVVSVVVGIFFNYPLHRYYVYRR